MIKLLLKKYLITITHLARIIEQFAASQVAKYASDPIHKKYKIKHHPTSGEPMLLLKGEITEEGLKEIEEVFEWLPECSMEETWLRVLYNQLKKLEKQSK